MTDLKCCSNCAKFKQCPMTSKFKWNNDNVYCSEWTEEPDFSYGDMIGQGGH